jgi:NACHT domain
VLHMRSPDGRLFDMDYQAAVFRHEAIAKPRQSAGTISLVSRPDDLTILLVRMKNRIAESLRHLSDRNQQTIEMEMEVMTEAASKSAQTTAKGLQLSQFFKQNGGSILVLGDPGSGKSTSFLMLACDLIERAELDSTCAVPIIIPLSSWNGEPMMKWVVEQIRVAFTYPADRIQEFLKANQLLLLLDGLDEVSDRQRSACVDAINDFAPEVGLAGIAISSRTREYLELPNRLSLTAAVKIKGLTREEILQQVESWGPDFCGLYQLLQHDTALQILARSPLMLGLMAEVYRGLQYESEEAATSQLASAAERRDMLMERYVQHMFSRVYQGGSQ